MFHLPTVGTFSPVLGCRHLLGTHPKGIEIHAYFAIIACL